MLNSPPWNSGQPPWSAWVVAQIDGQLALDAVVDLAGEMLEHDVLGGDGGIRLELKAPVAFVVLARLQIGRRLARRRGRPPPRLIVGQRDFRRIDLGQPWPISV